jgi:urease accessory protein UreF
MADELRLLGALRITLGRMDDALARDDGDAVDEAVYAAHRVMRTLTEAQRRRNSLVEISELRVGTSSRGSAMRAAVSRLMECGETLDAEIRSRCRVLEGAVAAGTNGRAAALMAASPVPA